MAHGLRMNEVDAYQAYVQEFSTELMNIALQGFRTAGFLTADNEVVGKKTYTVRKSDSMILKEFSTTYSSVADQIKLIPKTIQTHTIKAEIDITPSEIRQSYLGRFALPNQDVVPAFIIDTVSYWLLRMMTDYDTLLWSSDTTGSGVTSVFDGFDKQIADAVTATDLTAIATGAITATNVVEKFEEVYDAIDDVYKNSGEPLLLYTSKKNKDLYARKERADFGKYTDDGHVKTMLFGTNCEIVDVPTWAGTSKVLVAPQNQMIYGFDGNSPNMEVKVIDQHYTLEHSVTPEIGCLILNAEDGVIAANDQF